MAAPIQRVMRLASKTFARFHPSESSHRDRLSQLRSAFNEIRASDVNFDSEAVREHDRQSPNRAPVSYIHLWEDDAISMGIFILKSGGRLPLHDHPGMFGLIKVIHGTLKIMSLTEIEGVRVPDEIDQRVEQWQKPLLKSVRLESEVALTADHECGYLTPSRGNFHQITTETEMAAFVDILAPPYDHSKDRDCHYYSEIRGLTLSTAREVNWIMRVPQPLDFWCDSLDYTGPDLDDSHT
ncbi:2-aminoethanethiol dioxygenase-like [Babylonia areolata]|uniref:2-aminoethanethiol dioxygenase-like n=1 Tax=Babylonia areolata TaxID=304850 RepID=UPI003FD61DED